MRYGLATLFGQHHFVEITPDEFVEAKVVKRNLVEALDIEVNFDMILGNYEEFELDLLRATLHRALYAIPESLASMEAIQLYNRRLVNLLTTCKQYLDQVSHHLSTVYGPDSAAPRAFKQSRSKEYDAHFSYRLLEALRNHVQHRGLPISTVWHYSWREEGDARSNLKYVVTPLLKVAPLREDEKVNAAFRIELEGVHDEELDLKLHVREYIGGLGRVHAEVRDLLARNLQEWDGVYARLHETYRTATGADAKGLVAVEESATGVWSERIHISHDLIERRRALERKHWFTKNYAQNIVTGEVRLDKPRTR